MIFKQLFDKISCTYTYLIGSRKGGEAVIIDPVLDNVNERLLDSPFAILSKAI